jgi:hypothetical protein
MGQKGYYDQYLSTCNWPIQFSSVNFGRNCFIESTPGGRGYVKVAGTPHRLHSNLATTSSAVIMNASQVCETVQLESILKVFYFYNSIFLLLKTLLIFKLLFNLFFFFFALLLFKTLCLLFKFLLKKVEGKL